MNYLYEHSDILNTPYEAFMFDTFKDSFPVRSHFHPYVEMIYMLEGNMFATCDKTEYYMSEGNLILFFRDSVHSLSASSVKGAKFVGIKFDIARLTVNTSITPKLQTMLSVARGQKARIFFDKEETGQKDFEGLFTECAKELNEKRMGYDIVVHAKLCILMTGIIRIWQKEGIDFTNVSEYVSKEELNIQNILEYIDMHLDENLKVDELAKRCNMSYSHFARSFKEQYGRSCKEHLELLRVEKAEELLKFTDISLNDISNELGYADQSHFIRAFKKLKGITPGNIRSIG
ncbi:MAG: AraC family transcriptional regulator [Lachnospiraceae bacterium]|nr:AraC family transcriptional regulator [Lachnospiraceae bacterium]